MASMFGRSSEKVAFARRLRREVTATERRLWPHLRGERLGVPFRRQYSIGPYFADYCCVPLRLVVEVDGPWHTPAADAARDAFMRRLGFTVLRFSDQQIWDEMDGVVATIEREIWVLKNGG